jgi:hypothetical protein
VLQRRLAALQAELSARETECESLTERLRHAEDALPVFTPLNASTVTLPPAPPTLAGPGLGEALVRTAAVLQLGVHRCYTTRDAELAATVLSTPLPSGGQVWTPIVRSPGRAVRPSAAAAAAAAGGGESGVVGLEREHRESDSAEREIELLRTVTATLARRMEVCLSLSLCVHFSSRLL